MITANAAAQRWVDDALAFPRAIPASVRTALDAGIVAHGGGLYLASAYRELDLSPAALERFVNTVRLDTLRPVQRIPSGSEAWVYECVAIGIAIGLAVLAVAPAASVLIRVDLDDVEHPDATVTFGSTVDDAESPDLTQGIVVLRA